MAVDLGSDEPDIGSSHQNQGELLGELARLFVTGSTALSKTSYGLALLRLMNTHKAMFPRRKLRWLIVLILVSINLIIWPAALFPLVACDLGSSTASGQCWASGVDIILGVAGTGWSGAADVTLALLPLEAIWNHEMPRLSRSLVILAMTMGFVAAAAAFTQCSQIPTNNTTALACKHSPVARTLC